MEVAGRLRRHLGDEISMHKLQNPNRFQGSLRTGFGFLRKTIRISHLSGSWEALSCRMLDNRRVVKEEFRKGSKKDAGQTITWEGHTLDISA